MTQFPFDPSIIVSRSLDYDPAISADSMLQKFLIRWKFFAVCAVVVPLLAVSIASLIPSSYSSSAQLLIRHEGGTDSFYSDVTFSQQSLSGTTAAELLKSDPIDGKMIEAVGVEDEDIARPGYKVLFGKAAKLILPLFGGESPDATAASDPRIRFTYLAKELKPSIDSTTLMADRISSNPRDELVEVTLKSTNREKVAAMVNGLCEAFISEYNRRSHDEIMAAYATLSDQAKIVAKEINRLREPTASGSADYADLSEQVDSKPLASDMARTLSDLELRVLQLRQSYTDTNPDVIQATAELARARAMLSSQEATDAAKETYSVIKRKQRQLLLAAKLAESGQGNISIVERGVTPRKTKLTVLMRYGIPLASGLGGGVFLGCAGLIMLNFLDPRIFLAGDAARISSLPLLGIIPSEASLTPDLADVGELPRAGARPALLQALGKLDVLASNFSRVIVVSSAENESATASVSMQLAALIARDRESRVLLVDANFDHPRLTLAGGAQSAVGLLEMLGGACKPEDAVVATKNPRLMFLGTGSLGLRDEAGSAREHWVRFLEYCRREFRATVINTGGLLNSREAATLAKAADRTILVTSRGTTKRDALKGASAFLSEINVLVLGVVHCDKKTEV